MTSSMPNTGNLNIETAIEAMRRAGRNELVHYAGGAHRDLVAWHMTAEWLKAPFETEPVLKSRAIKAAWGWDVSPDQMGPRS